MILDEFRSHAQGLPDLLPWAALIDNGVVLTKSGGLLAGFEYRGPDLDSATKEELAAVSARINAALALDDGWSLHVDAVRRQSPGYPLDGAFPDRTTRLLDDCRRLAHEGEWAGFQSDYKLVMCWHPDPDAAAKTEMLFVDGAQKAGVAQRSLIRFKTMLTEIEARLASTLKIRRLQDTVDPETGVVRSPLLAHLAACVALEPRSSFAMGTVPMYLDSVLGQHDFVTGFEPQIDGKTALCIAVTGFPGSSFPGILDFLSRLPVEYRWSNRFIFMPVREAEKELGKYRSKWAQKRLSLMNLMRSSQGGDVTHVNADADGMATDAVAAMAEASSALVRFGYYTSVVLLSSSQVQPLREAAQFVIKTIANAGFSARVESVNAVEAYLGSMPGNLFANVRRPLVNTLNLAHLLPLTAIWAGPDVHPCPFYPEQSAPLLQAKTDGATPYRLCLHAGDLGHTAIIGPTGSGKSTLLATMVAQHFRYCGAQAFVFDKGYSMFPLVAAAGGQHYDIAGEADDITFCPLGQIDDDGERSWAAEWLESLAELQGVAMSPELRKELFRAVNQLAASTDCTKQRTLSNFLLTLQDNRLREALEYYSLRGSAGRLLDAESDGLQTDIFQVFELEHLMGRGEKIVLPVLAYLFHRLEQRFEGQPTLLVLDEAWVMLGHPAFRTKLREWLKVLRKSNVAVIFATQSLSDLSHSGIDDVIFESCPSKILLPSPQAQTEALSGLYQAIGLNRRQIQIVSNAVPKRQYYHLHPDGSRVFELGLTPPEMAFVGASGRDDLARIRHLQKLDARGWPSTWLRERGQFDAARLWESY
jgi:type IV secretion/conjugal transfer VirB4 family ATPase